MPQWLKTEAASLLHTLRLLWPQIFRNDSLYKGPLLRLYHISFEAMLVPEKGLSKSALPLLTYLRFDGSTSFHTWIYLFTPTGNYTTDILDSADTARFETMQIIFMQKRSREIICEARLVVKMDLHFAMQFFSYFSQDKIVRTHRGWAAQTSGVITYQNVSHLLKCHGCMVRVRTRLNTNI